MRMLLYFIRHGDPDYANDSLTPRGARQAEAVAKRLAVYGLDEVYTSSLNRAVLTAKPTCELLGLTPQLCDWAREDYPWRELTVPRDGGGVTWPFFTAKYSRLFNSPEVIALGRHWADSPLFADTTFKQGYERTQKAADDFLLSLGYRHDCENGLYTPEKHNDKRVALFAHQGFGMIFLSCVLDVPYPLMCTHFDLSHSSMTVIEFSPNTEGYVIPKALQLSNDSHLYKEGLPTWYQNVIKI
jgi:probable phosphoglycerate mutase